MRINCPSCEKSLSLGQPKTGRYRPKCKYCGEPFDLRIDPDGMPAFGLEPEATQLSADRSVAAQYQETPVPIATDGDAGSIPDRLGGYRVLRLLGRGAMGTVYEAKQISLDRLVALKTIRGRLAENPASLARFTREAYAAAQLTHHNVVQIYDFGEADGLHFFSMEWVRGGPLDHLIREKGRLEPRLAASYAVQAARGLQFAHQHGMVHRDIKPANLLLTKDGIVKVADLGLVKIPDHGDTDSEPDMTVDLASGTQVTLQGTAVGTPAYMAPEQSLDAAGVDARADIYSLGCTLFFMLAGRPPFEGAVVSDVKQQHATAQPPPLTQINHRVPGELQKIVSKAMEKHVDQRYESLAGMIRDLESYLGLAEENDFSPTSQQVDVWEAVANRFRDAARFEFLSTLLLCGCLAFSVGLTCVLVWLGAGPRWVLTGIGIIVGAIVFDLIASVRLSQTPIVDHVRKWLGVWSRWDWGLTIVSMMTIAVFVFFGGLWPGLLIGLLLGAVLGFCHDRMLVLPVWKAQRVPLAEAERLIRDLRISGTNEDGLRSFVARHSGRGWQSLYEALFGYESLLKMREKLSRDSSFTGVTDVKSLRDRVCALLRQKTEEHQKIRDHQRLATIEERGLAREGLSADEARDRAWQIAAAVMENTKVESGSDLSPASASAQAAILKRDRMKKMIADARSGKYQREREPLAVARFALGGQTRFLVGCLLLSLFAMLGNSKGLFEQFKQIDALGTVSRGDLDQVSNALKGAAATATNTETRTLLFAWDIHVWSLGLAGLLLALSGFVSGWRMTPFAAVASLVILFGPAFGIPGLATWVPPWLVAAGIGVVIYLPGVIWGERADE
ncbi:serine/threonine protein kinase [bacterium]|nr:serine/threonine protein kinase [bacterium]